MNESLVLFVVAFTSCFSSVLSTHAAVAENYASIVTSDVDCQTAKAQFVSTEEAARELYKKAFILSFDDKWKEAEAASKCAAVFFRGETSWPIDAHAFLK